MGHEFGKIMADCKVQHYVSTAPVIVLFCSVLVCSINKW